MKKNNPEYPPRGTLGTVQTAQGLPLDKFPLAVIFLLLCAWHLVLMDPLWGFFLPLVKSWLLKKIENK